jgi:hypothetical protein
MSAMGEFEGEGLETCFTELRVLAFIVC